MAARPDPYRTVAADVHRLLNPGTRSPGSATGQRSDVDVGDTVLVVLASLAGEILVSGDEAAIADLQDSLGAELLADHPASDAIESVLAMARTYSLRRRMRHASPGRAPRRAYDTGPNR